MATSPGVCTALGVFFSMLLALINNNQNELKSPASSTCSQVTHFDYIIVGAGSAGCVLAERLSENRRKTVLLLEAGGPGEPIQDIPGMVALRTSTIGYNFQSEAKPDVHNGTPMTLYRGKGLGGSSNVNGMLYVRGNKDDYNEWERLGSRGWGYEDVLGYFLKSENNTSPLLQSDRTYHSTGGPLAVGVEAGTDPTPQAIVDAFAAIGIPPVDYNGGSQIGASVPQSTIFEGVRWGTRLAYLKRAIHRRNLLVKTRSRVMKIIISGVKATGVKYMDEETKTVRTAMARGEVIVSAGSIMSPQLLMLSGIGPEAHLMSLDIPVVKDLPVGKNLKDHIAVFGAIRFNVPVMADTDPLLVLNQAVANYSVTHRGPLATTPFNCLTFINTRCLNDTTTNSSTAQNCSVPNIQYQIRRDNRDCPSPNLMSVVYESISFLTTLLRPKSTGQILLQNKDPYTDPIIQVNFLRDPEDRVILREGLKFATRLYGAKSLMKLNITMDNSPEPGCEQYATSVDDSYWDCVINKTSGTSYHQASPHDEVISGIVLNCIHNQILDQCSFNIVKAFSQNAGRSEPARKNAEFRQPCTATDISSACRNSILNFVLKVGTCKMGPKDDGTNVVDSSLRVHGIKNLRVVDASIMPTIICGNTNAPTIMIATKAADLIIKRQ